MSTHHASASKAIAVLAMAAAALTACRTASPSSSSSPTPTTAPTVAAVGAPVAFHVRLDANQTFSLRTPGSCPGLDGSIQLGPQRRILLSAYAASCDARDTGRPGNGRHGTYRSTADIPADRRAGAVTFRTALGEATAFSQPYYECTNSCRDYTETVAVITLDHPSDPAYPALVAYADKGLVDRDELTTVLKTQLQP